MPRWIGLVREAWVEFERDRARYFAVAMVYYALISVVPVLLLILAALGLLLRFSAAAAFAQHQILEGIETNLGPELTAAITKLLSTLKQDSIIATVVGLCGLLFAASVLFRHLRMCFRAIWKYEPPLVSGPILVIMRTALLEGVISFLMVLGGGLLLLAALVLIAMTQWLLLKLPPAGGALEWLLGAASSLILAAITFACLFKYLPPSPLRWRDVAAASIVCAVSYVFVSELLSLYGMVFGKGPSAFGALGALLVVMLWMKAVSKLVFFGAELCKVTFMRFS